MEPTRQQLRRLLGDFIHGLGSPKVIEMNKTSVAGGIDLGLIPPIGNLYVVIHAAQYHNDAAPAELIWHWRDGTSSVLLNNATFAQFIRYKVYEAIDVQLPLICSPQSYLRTDSVIPIGSAVWVEALVYEIEDPRVNG